MAKAESRFRNKLTHRFLFYLHQRTSERFPEWRSQTIRFMYELFELMERNTAISAVVHREDGLYIFHRAVPIVYMGFRNRHFLLHTKREYELYKKGDALFSIKHSGSWPRMWKVTTVHECTALLNYLTRLPRAGLPRAKHTRTIPQWIKELVFERDRGRCVACGSGKDIHFDHILPFSMGGSSIVSENIQLLCARCNLEKSASFTK